MDKYAMCPILYQGEQDPEPRFFFEAENLDEAENAGINWAIYHGLNARLDVFVRPAYLKELNRPVHNEYLIKR